MAKEKINANNEKQCARCEQWLPVETHFYKSAPSHRSKYTSYCRPCQGDINKEQAIKTRAKKLGIEILEAEIKDDLRILKLKKEVLAKMKERL